MRLIMKKILIIFIFVCFLNSTCGFAFAEVSNLENTSTIYLDKKVKESVKKTQYTSPYIFCKKEVKNEVCDAVSITKTEIPLNSYLKKTSKAYSFTIKNNLDKDIEIIKFDSSFRSPNTAIKMEKSERIRFPKVLGAVALSPVIDALYVVSLVTVAPFVLQLAMCNDRKERLEFITLPITVPAAGVWYTMASPYYFVSDKMHDKEAKKETANFVKEFNSKDIKSFRELSFSALANQHVLYFKIKDSQNIYALDF